MPPNAGSVSRTLLFVVAAGLCAELVGCGTSSEPSALMAASGGHSSMSTGGAASGGVGGGEMAIDLPFGGRNPDSSPDQDEGCVFTPTPAHLQPLTMLVLFDRSTSMVRGPDPETGLPRWDPTRWDTAASALKAFIQDPLTDGLGLALRFFPDDRPAAGCLTPTCDAAACSQPLIEAARLTAELAPQDAHEAALLDAIELAIPTLNEDGGTPTAAALEGAVAWAKNHQVQHPDERTAIVMVTDGSPTGCERRIWYMTAPLSDALSYGIRTYFIGLTDSEGEGLREDLMEELASAGGTEKPYFIEDGSSAASELVQTFSTVQGKARICDFILPESTSLGEPIDPARVNVRLSTSDGEDTDFVKVLSPANCDESMAWHYDDEAQPQRIQLCPSACEWVSGDLDADVTLLVGCDSIIIR